MLAWSAVLPLAKRALPLPRLVRLVRPRSRGQKRDHARETAIEALSAWVFKTRPPGARDNCLERGLVAYRYLARAGADPMLVVGMPRTPGGHGHVWVSVDGAAVHDSPERLAEFEPVLAFASDGRLVLGEGAAPLGAGERERERPERER
jgi:transglutaminase superfamily protein